MEPRKKIEFLANEVMGDLVSLMDRIEALPALLSNAEGALTAQAEVAVQAAIAAANDDIQRAAIKALEGVAEKATANIKVAGEVAAAGIASTTTDATKTIAGLVARLEKATKVARWGVVEIFWYIIMATAFSSAGTVYLLKFMGFLK